jgi:phage repressor protein C with HTH and peptisase S24 domain
MHKTYPRIIDLFKEDLKAGETLRGIVRKTKLNSNTVANYLEGITEPTQSSLEKISNAYGKSIAWLRGDTNEHTSAVKPSSLEARTVRKIPVISMAQAGDNGFWIDAYPLGSGMEMIDCPGNITDPAAIAFKIEGSSMIPRYYPGEIVIIDTTKEVTNGNDVVVKLRDGRVMVKQYRRTNGTIILESYNKAEELIIVADQDIERCYRVVCRM